MNCISLLTYNKSFPLNYTQVENSQSEDTPYIYNEQDLQIIDRRSKICKIKDFICSIFREIAFMFSMIPRFVSCCFFAKYDRCDKEKVWKAESQGLYVLVHGLKSHPAVWDEHRDKILREQPNHDLFIPYVPHNGNCSVEDATNPILEKVVDYAKKFPNNPICLLGTSNGGRIVHKLDNQLRALAPASRVMVSTIAGVHFGSTKMTAIHNSSFLKFFWGIRKTLSEELSFGSQKAREILDAMQQPLQEGTKRKYAFYGTTEDSLAIPLNTVFPKVGVDKEVSYLLVYGYGHCSLISRVCEDQLDRAKEWMR